MDFVGNTSRLGARVLHITRSCTTVVAPAPDNTDKQSQTELSHTCQHVNNQTESEPDNNFLTAYSDVKPIDNRCFRGQYAVVSSLHALGAESFFPRPTAPSCCCCCDLHQHRPGPHRPPESESESEPSLGLTFTGKYSAQFHLSTLQSNDLLPGPGPLYWTTELRHQCVTCHVPQPSLSP